MKETLDRLSKIQAPVCVSLVLNTHRTFPENKQDSILLKNMISEANQRLQSEFDSGIAERYTKKLQEIAEDIDHNHNDLGLMLFVNDDVAEFLRLPIRLHNRVIIDETFTTRPIVRALKRASNYYVLALSKGKARLIEAASDSVVKEIEEEGFPISDSQLLKFSTMEGANASRVTNLTQEFFNRIDKSVNQIRKDNPLPVIIYSEETNYHQYLKEADYPNTILGHVLLKNFDEKAGNIIKDDVWPHISELTVENNRARITELENAISSGKVVTDINEIWRAAQGGRGATIFVEEGFFQAVRDEGDKLVPIELEDISSKEDIDDIVDEMIEHVLKFGGDVVFIEKGGLKEFNQVALVTRY